MTLDDARAILARPAHHDDARIRTAAKALTDSPDPEDRRRVQQFLTFGLRRGPDTTGDPTP